MQRVGQCVDGSQILPPECASKSLAQALPYLVSMQGCHIRDQNLKHPWYSSSNSCSKEGESLVLFRTFVPSIHIDTSAGR